MELTALTNLQIEEIYQNFLVDLAKIIAVDSSRTAALPDFPFGKGSAEALEIILNSARNSGMKAVNLNNYCGYIEIGNGAEMAAAVCHIDVVPAGDLKSWKYPPFKLTCTNEALYGRGVADNKGALIMIYELLKFIHSGNLLPGRRLRLIIGCAEESGCECMDYYSNHAEIPQYAITPDASYPLINGEKGILHFAFKRQFAAENPLIFTSGSVINAVPDYAEARFNLQTFSASGLAAHASTPDDGENAALKLAAELPDFPENWSKILLQLNRKNLNLELSDRYSELTLVPSVITSSETDMQIKCDIRFPVTMKSSSIIEKLQIFANSHNLALEIINCDEPIFFNPDSEFIQNLLQVYREVSGDSKAQPLVIGGGTYAKHLANTVAFGTAFPGEKSSIHCANEHWNIDAVKMNIQILHRALQVLSELPGHRNASDAH